MTIDFNYGKRTGVTSFKQIMTEFCENLHKYQPFILAWIEASSLDAPSKALLVSAINAVDNACVAAKQLPDD